MTIQQVDPYLSFDGDAAAAIALYERALGAQVERIMRYGDVKEFASVPGHAARVMHCVLRLGASRVLLSDAPPGMEVATASRVHVSLDFDDAAEAAAKFDALAAGGRVLYPLHDTFFGAKLGGLTDRFGISWTFHCAAAPTKA
ncbi:VOC family protein [Sandaracinus amylolyticus]|uniref:Putative DNA binding 3-demethylubiquinone-9 3-methyltransferase domain protein n=1 Tax=Sandaracinus amylolyticus TaxID=927083 RepID=A0A0F6YNF5_9BACT|nr:glyoxalase/bleomycin resistance/extradiol dioxygenase family protein [Sandaracinus amylolyticus]AKF10363.1 putative DNA binding 3-demethylubiquinone-9 3-methyltransferase domain protein [Sandaracinus amylolyticus]